MSRLLRALIGLGMAVMGLTGCGADVPLPPAPSDSSLSEREKQAFVEAMRPRRSGRPVIVVLALNEGTETTDLLLSHAVLQRAGVADVQVVAPRRGRVALYPVLEVEATQDLAGFDRAHPSGADYVVVPAMLTDDDPTVTAWLRQQAGHGARIIGVCNGVLVVGRAGLLDGRRFSGHWYARKTLLERHPGATYVPHQRYVVDRNVATTTGITASVPTMLALVEAIGGREKAQSLASELGVTSWSPTHDSTPFYLDARRRSAYLLNKAAFWRHERWAADVQNGSDDIALALAADAWSRTGRVSVEASAAGPVSLRSGLVLVAQPVDVRTPRLPLAPELKPVQQLDRTLCEIAERYGASRRDWVMLEMEYSGGASACASFQTGSSL
jgi:transcriptional regulator GlxA family with amidase domain